MSEEKSGKTKGKIARNLVMLIAILVPVLASLGLGILTGKNNFDSKMAQTILQLLIQANVTLIGFFGIMFTYFVKSQEDHATKMFSLMTQTEEKLLDFQEKQDRETDPIRRKVYEDTYNMFRKRLKVASDSHEKVFQTVKYIYWWGICVISFFVASIFTCITFLLTISDSAFVSVSTIGLPLLLMLDAIFFLAWAFWANAP